MEAYPIECRSHGRPGATRAGDIPGVGPVGPAHGGFNNVSTSGVISMFEKEGFVPVAACGSTSARIHESGGLGDHVVMHKRVGETSVSTGGSGTSGPLVAPAEHGPI